MKGPFARLRRALLVAGLGAVAACASTLPVPTARDATWAQARWPGATVDALAEGRELYVRKCGGCHQLYPADQVPAARWPATVAQMSERAAIGPRERDLITHYLLTAARGP